MSLPDGDNGSGPSQPNQSGRQQPLFIVSEQGRHTDESRRIVRAQAARASAAQSRVTRARNREERESTVRSPTDDEPVNGGLPLVSVDQLSTGIETAASQMPLAFWLPCIIGGATGAVVQQASSMAFSIASSTPRAASNFSNPGTSSLTCSAPVLGFEARNEEPVQSPGEGGKFQLPLAIPRGFTTLQQRIPISSAMIDILSRTACFDFASPGVEQRLHRLLFDLIANIAGSAITMQPEHPIQAHLRVACTCITIFQGQRADGQLFAQDHKYQIGLEAAWSEATLLDRTALDEPKSAEASLWAVFMISVTTGATANFFHQQLRDLLRDLQLRAWEQVRKVLLDFIYPVSFLDEPCKTFYNSLHSMQQGLQAVVG